MSREKNKLVAEDTLNKVNQYKKLRECFYYNSDLMKDFKNEPREKLITNSKTTVEVNNLDVVESMFIESSKGGTVGVLNFASARNPGGGFLKGANAQEEALCRVSDLYLYIKDVEDFYKNPKHFKNGLYDNDLIYSKNVSVIKDNLFNDLENPINLDIITCAAVNVSDLKAKGQKDLLKFIDKAMEERIENIIEISLINEVDTLILGAFGCGVFGNSGYKVRGYFEKVLNKDRYKNKFKRVVFSIYGDNDLYNIFKGIRI